MPAQLPQPGHEVSSIFSRSLAEILAAFSAPTPSKTVFRSEAAPVRGLQPGDIGPPEAKIVGMLTRRAPSSMPGTILSQLGTQIMASKQCARATVSTASAISSRDGSEYFMPAWAMARPSQTAMVLNSIGTPPRLDDRLLQDLADVVQVT